MKTNIKPTEAELEILNVLWTEGPCTVREVHEKLSLTKEAGYTTTLKQMQIMLEKQLLKRDDSNKKHVYESNVKRELAQGQIVQRMIDTVFNGSASQLVMHALGQHKATKEELELIKEYLDKKTKK